MLNPSQLQTTQTTQAPQTIDASGQSTAVDAVVLEIASFSVPGSESVVKSCGTLGPVEEFRGRHAGEPFSVSVVVATYNRLDGLRNLLVDLCAQNCDRGSFEIVVVDDESRIPVTLAVADQALATQADGILPFGLRLFRRPNGGPGVARDTGIGEALGDIVVILDDDMHIQPEFLRAHIDRHRGGATVVLGNIQTPHHGELALFERFHMGTIDKFVAAVGRGEPVVEGARLCTGNVSFLRSAYRHVGGFDTNLRRCEDRDLGIRFELAGEHIVFGEAAVSQHQSDHTDVATWQKRNRLYGELDTVIAAKHPSMAKISPWAFLSELPRLATPVGLLSATFPAVGKLGGSMAYRLANMVDRRSKTQLALRLTGLSYGLDYYAGVGGAFHSPKGALSVWSSYRSFRRLADSTTLTATPTPTHSSSDSTSSASKEIQP
jgi:glycosyltransferase involved in cell wall biosynthesis